MYLLTRPIRFAALAVAALSLVGCASMNVSSYVERGSDFAQYRTYGWAPTDAFETGDPRLDANAFFHDRIQSDIEKELATRGFEKSTSGRPDLIVHYHASIHQKIDASGLDQEYGYCAKNECSPYVYEAGTLLVDFVDGRTNKLVWRGWAEDTVDGIIDHQQLLERKLDKAVSRILQRLPGRL